MKKISRFFPKAARVTAFVLACITAGTALCSRAFEWECDVEEFFEIGPDSDYLTSAGYRSQLAEMYEQLCILGVCELANSDKDMNYVGNKYVMNDFLYYMDFNQYKYKKTDDGVIPVSDMFDYYVSYTRPVPIGVDEDIADEETTDGETSADESAETTEKQEFEKQTLFVTNIPDVYKDMSESERILRLQNRFSNYILRLEDIVSSDMTSSGNMIYYQYKTVEDGKVSDWITENYPSNFLPLGCWYTDNYGRNIFHFGNDESIMFYINPKNTKEGEKARKNYVDIKLPMYDVIDNEDYYSRYYEYIYEADDDEYYASVPIELLEDYEAYPGDTMGLTVFIAPKADLLAKQVGEYSAAVHSYNLAHTVRVIFKTLTVLLMIYLLAAAVVCGLNREMAEGIWWKIPLEAYGVAFFFLTIYIFDSYVYDYVNFNDSGYFRVGSLFFGLVGALLWALDMLIGGYIIDCIFARRLKKSLITPKLFGKALKKYRSTELYKEHSRRTAGQKLWRRTWTVLGAFGLTVSFMILVIGGTYWDIEWLLFVIALLACIVFIGGQVKNLFLARELGKLGRRILALKHNEDFNESVSEGSDIYSDITTLDHISDSVREAVEDQIKSERMKIELVANVSHDLKTPLTSIISYIDLLKKTELSDEARDYVQILDKKSQKLKSIVADVFSLAKATSGIDVEMEELDFVTLFNQSFADSEDKIKSSGKIIKVMVKEKQAPIMGDGNKLYRVFQNIIDNALKYSMEGSRIFMDIERVGDNIVFTAKNISSYPIDFTADEIIERFVRGDKSRTDGGSGLGLSIAKSFTEACGGRFEIELDGDMFKAIAVMPIRKTKHEGEKEEAELN